MCILSITNASQAHRPRVLLWLWMVLAITGVAHRTVANQALPGPPDQSASVVCVETVSAKDQRPKRCTGVVIRDGIVVTPYQAVDDVLSARVQDAAGAWHTVTGVCGYHKEANIAALAVQWAGQAPPGIELVPDSFGRADRIVSMLWRGRDDEAPTSRIEVTIFADQAFDAIHLHVEWPKGLRSKPAGAALIDEHGRLCGVIQGFGAQAVLSSGIPSRRHLYAARAELIAALQVGPVMEWAPWRESVTKRIEPAHNLSRTALYERDAERALAMARECTALDAGCSLGWMAAAQALYKLERYDDADAAIQQALTNTPTDASALSLRSLILYAAGRYTLAAEAADKALELNPGESIAWEVRAGVLQRNRQFDAAIEAYRSALRHRPRSESARSNLARLLESLGRPREALEVRTGRPPEKQPE